MLITVSVRHFVEFLMRSGDIDDRGAGAPEEAMQEGTRIHRMLQKQGGAGYRAEVPLRFLFDAGDYGISLEGRADGIMEGDVPEEERQLLTAEESLPDLSVEETVYPVMASQMRFPETAAHVTIDEIKGVYRDVSKMKEPVPVHLAQAKCYAFFYGKQENEDRMRVRMTYCNIETEEIRYFFYEYGMEELERWFMDMLEEYRKFTDYEVAWAMARNESIKQLEFPFPYREGQRDLVAGVYRTIYHRKKLFIEAPTGVGKTISTVFPAVKAMGEGLGEKIFYLTAKTITRTVAQDTFEELRKKDLAFKTVTLTAKEKICIFEETRCNPEDCPRAKGHFDRINEAIYDLLTHEVNFGREQVEAYALKHNVCPFEMSLDMSLFADGVICDYNYVFDPHAYLRRFFGEGQPAKDYLFLIDEAHNLLDRGREMYSAVLIKEDFQELSKLVKSLENDAGLAIKHAADRCNRELRALKKLSDEMQVLDDGETAPFVMACNRLDTKINEYLEDQRKKKDKEVRKEILTFKFQLSHFLSIWEKLDENYRIYSDFTSDGRYFIKLLCINPKTNLKECMVRARSSILFSATLLPIQYYKELLGGEAGDYEIYANSVFDPGRRGVFIAEDVTSKYTRRGPEEYSRIAEYISKVTGCRKGNYLIFFPSYAFLQEVYDIYRDFCADEETEEYLVQSDTMDEAGREAFLKAFATEREKSLLGFCVMGGIFSEGIDLREDMLIGAIIVGTGLPQVCGERELMSAHFNAQGERGFSYAYQYPGMNKVTQAAGRVIRTVSDVGVVVLLDERFWQNSYRSMFPREWSGAEKVSLRNIEERVHLFWKKWDNI